MKIKKYEVYVNGTLAKRCLTYSGAVQTAAQYPKAFRTIYKIQAQPQAILQAQFEKGEIVRR